MQGKAYVGDKLLRRRSSPASWLTAACAADNAEAAAEPEPRESDSQLTRSRMNIHPTAIIDPVREDSLRRCTHRALLRDRCRGGDRAKAAISSPMSAIDGPSRFGTDNKILSLRVARHGAAGH